MRLYGSLACALFSACSGCPTEPEIAQSKTIIAERDAGLSLAVEKNPVRLEQRFESDLGPDWALWRHQVDEDQSSIKTDKTGLRMELETYGRAHDEVSVVAVAWKPAVDFLSEPQTITLGLQWLEDSNAAYLSAGLAIVPEHSALEGDPRDLSEVTHLSFIGVGPGALARRELLVQRKGQEIARDTEGWPEKEKGGRQLNQVVVKVAVTGALIRIEEDGREPVSVSANLGFARGRIVLFVASHSNSMRRAVRFTQLRVE